MSNKTSNKNVVNIEEDIKLVKRYLENSAYKETDRDFFKNGGWEMVDLEIPKAMANILAEREQMLKAINTVEKEKGDWIKAYQEEKDSQFDLLKRIKELEKENADLKKYNKTVSDRIVEYKKNSIPTQVVIDKMEELNKEIKNCDEIDAIFKIKQQQVLQELLETK